MSYVLCTKIENKFFCISTNVEDKKFELVEVRSEADLSKTFSTPHKSGAMQILRWINENNPELACQDIKIQEEARHRTGTFSGL
jgi:hypothetical protein